jgi:methionine-rich copper-binding protein CopC
MNGIEEPGMSRTQPRRHRSVVTRLPAVLLLATLLAVAAPFAAHAHTDLVGSTPRAGDTVAMGTGRLVLVFGDDLAGSAQVAVRDADEVDVAGGGTSVRGDTVEVPLDLQRSGRHVVTYRVVSADGHVVVGEFAFEVARAPGTPREPAPQRGGEGAAPLASTRGDRAASAPLEGAAGVAVPEATAESSPLTPARGLVAVGVAATACWLLLRRLPRRDRRPGSHPPA